MVKKYDEKACIGIFWLKKGSAGGFNTHPGSVRQYVCPQTGEDFKGARKYLEI
jgi:hypothetical protein